MSMFGQNRDIQIFNEINRELLHNIIEQKAGYYKIVLGTTESNVYGESTTKTFNDPVLINCLIDRGDQVSDSSEQGPNLNRKVSFRFFRPDLVCVNVVPEIGDIILWDEDYYEVDTVVENQYIVGKYPEYSYSPDTDDFGESLSIICVCHYTRKEALGISKDRL